MGQKPTGNGLPHGMLLLHLIAQDCGFAILNLGRRPTSASISHNQTITNSTDHIRPHPTLYWHDFMRTAPTGQHMLAQSPGPSGILAVHWNVHLTAARISRLSCRFLSASLVMQSPDGPDGRFHNISTRAPGAFSKGISNLKPLCKMVWHGASAPAGGGRRFRYNRVSICCP